MKSTIIIFFLLLATCLEAHSQSGEFINKKIELAGTVTGLDKRISFPAETGRLLISCSVDYRGPEVSFCFFRGTSDKHENGYFFTADSQERNRWSMLQYNSIETLCLSNENLISETEVELNYYPEGILTVTYRMWDGDTDDPFVSYSFSGKCNNWSQIKQLLTHNSPFVALKTIDIN